MSIPFEDRRKGVRGGPRALQGISVDTRPSQQRRILSDDGFEFAMPRASPGPLWFDSDTLEGRSGLRWDVREDSLRPSALSKARLDARAIPEQKVENLRRISASKQLIGTTRRSLR